MQVIRSDRSGVVVGDVGVISIWKNGYENVLVYMSSSGVEAWYVMCNVKCLLRGNQ